jgi:acetylornithine deacetylase
MDTVPADDWPDTAFTPRLEGDILYGRGACDDKGPLTSMILAVMDLLETDTRPHFPALLLCAGDEEHAQTGIRTFRNSPYKLGRGIFGEPTSCLPVVQHRGTIRWDITVHGKSAHTSKPHLGVNAILGMMEVIAALQEHQRDVQTRYTSDLLPGPALTVTMIHGGRTRNAVPDECTISVDYRIVPGMGLEESLEEVKQRLAQLGHKITHQPSQIMTRPLDTSPNDPFSRQVWEVCRHYVGPEAQLQGVPYGTDAAWVSDLIPALVLGPGSIDSAHAVDEHIDLNEVVTCAQIYRDILLLGPTDRD